MKTEDKTQIDPQQYYLGALAMVRQANRLTLKRMKRDYEYIKNKYGTQASKESK